MKNLTRRFDFTTIALVAAMVVLLSTVFTVTAPRVHAQESNLESLQQRISQLLEIVADLQKQMSAIKRGGEGHVKDYVKNHVKDRCPYRWNRSLYKGSSGDDVKHLQHMLHKLGHYDEEKTGYFGDKTEEALKGFQRDKEIISNGDASTTGYGMFGPLTRAKMGEKCKSMHSGSGDVHKKADRDYVKKYDKHKKEKAHKKPDLEDYDACVAAGGEIWADYHKCGYGGHYYYDEDAKDDKIDSDVDDYDACVDMGGEIWEDYNKCEYEGEYYYE